MGEHRFYAVASINVYSGGLNIVEGYEDAIQILYERLVRMVESRMDVTMFQCLHFELPDLEILRVFRPEVFKHSYEGDLVRLCHVVGDRLECAIGFESWVFEQISINRGYLVGLADLHGNVIVRPYDGLHPVPPIDDREEWCWILCALERFQESCVILSGFLEDMFRSENVPSNSILRHEQSPLCIRTLAPKEGSIEDQNGRFVRGYVGTYMDSSKVISHYLQHCGYLPMDCTLGTVKILCDFREGLFPDRVLDE